MTKEDILTPQRVPSRLLLSLSTEDKELLLRDLYARVPYRVHAKVNRMMLGEEVEYAGEVGIDIEFSVLQAFPHKNDIDIKPYLRPMSSMTEEERKEYTSLCNRQDIDTPTWSKTIWHDTYKSIDWLNKKMFDYRGLIQMGLAIEAPEGMYD